MDRFDPREQIAGPVPMLPTRQGAQNYVMLLAEPGRNADRWAELPPLEGANRLTLKRNLPAEVLAESARTTNRCWSPPSTAAAGCWPSPGTPPGCGRCPGSTRSTPGSGGRSVLWLTRKEEDTDGPVFVVAEPRNVVPGRPARLKLGARDAEGEPGGGRAASPSR